MSFYEFLSYPHDHQLARARVVVAGGANGVDTSLFSRSEVVAPLVSISPMLVSYSECRFWGGGIMYIM